MSPRRFIEDSKYLSLPTLTGKVMADALSTVCLLRAAIKNQIYINEVCKSSS